MTKPAQVTIVVSCPNHPYKVELRWSERLSTTWASYIENIVDNLPGVEKVVMHRYAMEVFFSTHIVTAEALRATIVGNLGAHLPEKLFTVI